MDESNSIIVRIRNFLCFFFYFLKRKLFSFLSPKYIRDKDETTIFNYYRLYFFSVPPQEMEKRWLLEFIITLELFLVLDWYFEIAGNVLNFSIAIGL